MKKLIVLSISLTVMLLLFTSCMTKKGWVNTVKDKTFYSDRVAMVFDSKANIAFDVLDTDNNYSDASDSNGDVSIDEQVIVSIFESMELTFISSPQEDKAVYQINMAGQKLYQGFSTDGKNIHSYDNVVDDPKDINWSIKNPNIYRLK